MFPDLNDIILSFFISLCSFYTYNLLVLHSKFYAWFKSLKEKCANGCLIVYMSSPMPTTNWSRFWNFFPEICQGYCKYVCISAYVFKKVQKGTLI